MSAGKKGVTVSSHLMTAVTVSQRGHILLVRSKMLKGKGLLMAVKTGRWGPCGVTLEAAATDGSSGPCSTDVGAVMCFVDGESKHNSDMATTFRQIANLPGIKS